MSPSGNLSPMRFLVALLGAPFLGGFIWGVLNPSSGMDSFAGRLINGVLAAPMTVFTMLMRPDKVPSWLCVFAAFLLLLWLAIRVPRSEARDR